ncbi:MAG: hypothetical protein V4494_01500 [Chlamydiota bacterium]
MSTTRTLGTAETITLPEGMSEINAVYALLNPWISSKRTGSCEKIEHALRNRNFFILIDKKPIAGFFSNRTLTLYNYNAFLKPGIAQCLIDRYNKTKPDARFDKNDQGRFIQLPSSL